jgi:GNAT superfamily N-acetyltransferase
MNWRVRLRYHRAMSSVSCRVASDADVPAMARIRALTWGEEQSWKKSIRAYMAGVADPQKALKSRIVLVAEGEESIVGLIAGHLTRRYECDGELQWIDVVPQQRGQGVAAQLLRRLAEWFVEQKAWKICVDVQPKNTVARKFYRRHGAEDLNPHWMVWKDIRVVFNNSGG